MNVLNRSVSLFSGWDSLVLWGYGNQQWGEFSWPHLSWDCLLYTITSLTQQLPNVSLFLTTAPGVQPSSSRQRRPLVLPAAGASARPVPASSAVPAFPAHVCPDSFPAHVPLPAPEPHRPPAHHLPVGWGGTPTVPGPLHAAAAGPRAADGAEPWVGPGAAKPNSVRLPSPKPVALLSAGQVTGNDAHDPQFGFSSLIIIVFLTLLGFQSTGSSPQRPLWHQRVRSPGGLVPAAQAELSSRGISAELQRGDRALLPPDLQPEPSDCIGHTITCVLLHTGSAATSVSSARECGQQERKEYEGEVPEAPACVTVLLSCSWPGWKTRMIHSAVVKWSVANKQTTWSMVKFCLSGWRPLWCCYCSRGQIHFPHFIDPARAGKQHMLLLLLLSSNHHTPAEHSCRRKSGTTFSAAPHSLSEELFRWSNDDDDDVREDGRGCKGKGGDASLRFPMTTPPRPSSITLILD